MAAITNNSLNQKLDYAIEKIGGVDTKVDKLDEKLNANYITRDYFELRLQPLEQSKKIVFGFISLMLTGFAAAVIAFFISNP